MTIRDVFMAVGGAVMLVAVILGGFLFLLEADFSAFRTQPTNVECSDPTSELCRLRNFFRAQSQEDAVRRDCIRSGLPADCAD
jgi:hypothetical protein